MKDQLRASKMAQCEDVLAAKPEDLRLIPRVHMIEGENQLQQVALLPPRRQYALPYNQSINQSI